MAVYINTNVSSLNNVQNQFTTTCHRLSSGTRINSANAAGLKIADRLTKSG